MKFSLNKIILAAIVALCISACGQKGPLIVEKDDDAIQQDIIANTASAQNDSVSTIGNDEAEEADEQE